STAGPALSLLATISRHSSSSFKNIKTIKMIAPAAERNKEPILAIMRQYVPADGAACRMLEIASGTGQHCAHLAAGLADRGLQIQPSEIDNQDQSSSSSFASIEAHCRSLSNVCLPPMRLDISKRPCPEPPFGRPDIIFCANMIHISSTAAVEGLFANAGNLLPAGGRLITYGPYAIDGAIYPQSNADFNRSLRARNPDWGLRDTAYLAGLAEAAGMALSARHEMPANNWMLVFDKS
ncbi:hypothetical protein BOX15_Mlig030012g1, partial [Macrostomum lignano]